MLTYMTHPQHGVHVAYSDNEVEDCIKNGWTTHGPNPPKKQGEPAPVAAAIIESAKRKPGRPRKER